MIRKDTIKCSHTTLVDGKFCNKCGKKLNMFERIFATKEQLNNNDTNCICSICFAGNLHNHNFCNNCGNNLKGTVSDFPLIPTISPKRIAECDAIKDYLFKIGLLHLAEETFNINVQIENRESINIQLKGYQKSNDALTKLVELGVLSSDKLWRFTNWPIRPFYHRGSACVCELEMNSIYYIESYDMHNMRILYGCPNPSSIDYSSRMGMVRVEVVDYEKKQ